MASTAFSPVLRYIHRIAAGQSSHLSDSKLLDRFADGHDEEAFAVLVHRHGRLVLGACRRIVQDAHAAEDCFQAVFLVLAMKARTLARTESLGPWLHGVSLRVALKAKAQATTRCNLERKAAVGAEDDHRDDFDWRDLRPVLDDAIARLATRYRIPFVLCYLQGRTVVEIARELGQPKGTIAAQLARAREQLRNRLVRRGITLSAAGLTLALTESATLANVPPVLAAGTIKSAGLVAAGRAAAAALIPSQTAALVHGAMRSMYLTKVKLVGALSVVAMGSALLGYNAWAAEQPQEKEKPTVRTAVVTEKAKSESAVKKLIHTVHFEVLDVDEEGAEKLVASPTLQMYDKQTGTFISGEEVALIDNSDPKHQQVMHGQLTDGIRCSGTVSALPDGRFLLDFHIEKSQHVVASTDETLDTQISYRIHKVVKQEDSLKFEMNGLGDEDPKTRVRVTVSTVGVNEIPVVPASSRPEPRPVIDSPVGVNEIPVLPKQGTYKR